MMLAPTIDLGPLPIWVPASRDLGGAPLWTPPGTVSGPPVTLSPEVEAIAEQLKTLSPAEQTAYVQQLVASSQAGNAESRQILQGLASIADMVATPQGGTQPDLGKILLDNLPRIGMKLAAMSIPGVNVAVLVHDVAKMVTGGKIDLVRWMKGTFERLLKGDIGGAAAYLVQEYAEGMKALFIDAPIELMKDIWRVLSGKDAVGWAAFLLNISPHRLVGEVIQFFSKLIGGVPCEWVKKPECTAYTLWDNRKISNGDCCNPAPSGIGVLFASERDGDKRFPGEAVEMPAGDYVAATAREAKALPPLVDGQPNFALGMGAIGSLLVPPGYQAHVYTKPMFEGERLEFGPGTHRLEKLLGSVQVRGPWSIFDFTYGQNLMAQKTGWITSYMQREPTQREVMALVLDDPHRLRNTTSFAGPLRMGPPTWSPDWANLLESAGVLRHPVTIQILEKLGVPLDDIETSRMVARFLDRNKTIAGAPVNVPAVVVAGTRYMVRPATL